MKKKIGLLAVYFILDFVVIFGISFLTFLGLYNETYFESHLSPILIFVLIYTLVNIVVLILFKLYKYQVFKYGIYDWIKIGLIQICLSLLSLIFLFLYNDLNFEVKNIFSWQIANLTIFLILVITRSFPRVSRCILNRYFNKTKVRTMIIGAGTIAKFLIEDSINSIRSNNNIVVLVDDNRTKINTQFYNIPIEGPIENVKDIISKYQIKEVIIAISSISEIRLREILQLLNNLDVKIKRIPLLTEMNSFNKNNLLEIDPEELLNRDPVKFDNKLVSEMLNGKCVLVTGAGGSIGSELVRQIFNKNPSSIILFDIYENSTYDIQQELVRTLRKDNNKKINLVTLIGSTYNEKRIESVIKKYKPDYIYHAAAYKHVPLMEDSPVEAIRTNVIGTYNVARFANKYSVKKMVLVSTDKAVRPTNVMGATKRFAELIIQHFSCTSKSTIYAAVRFGNVLGSNGSVIPLFKKQIESGGPITITDKNIIRYFMTIPEAVSLILECGLYASNGEIFILDMGKPVRIYDLACKLIECAGLKVDEDIKIVETGLRPGEKLYEELLVDKENHLKTDNDKIFVETKIEKIKLDEEIKNISKCLDLDSNIEIKEILAKIINTYKIDKRVI